MPIYQTSACLICCQWPVIMAPNCRLGCVTSSTGYTLQKRHEKTSMLYPINLCEASCLKGKDVSSIFSHSGLPRINPRQTQRRDSNSSCPPQAVLSRGTQPGAHGTYRSRMILRTRGGFRSAACRQPASGSTRSGRCRRWSRRRARSHCCTGEKGQERQR